MAGKVANTNRVTPVRTLVTALLFWLMVGSTAASPQTTKEEAWKLLQEGVNQSKTDRRIAAVTALGVLQGDSRAIELAEDALKDQKPAVRAVAARTLGQLDARSAIANLREATEDDDSRVSTAAADALISLGDTRGYDLYYELITGERKTGEGLITEKKRLMSNSKEMTLLALGAGIGFAPYAGYGWMIWRELSKDYVSPVRVRALKNLSTDHDPRIGQGLVRAASDKHATVRVEALLAIARHGDPTLITVISPLMTDRKPAVRYAAAAAVLRLAEVLHADPRLNNLAALDAP